MRCRKRVESKGGCDGCGTIRTYELERFIYQGMLEKLREFRSLSDPGGKPFDPKLTAARVELAQVETNIEELVDSLTGANATLIRFANRKADELNLRRLTLTKLLADLTAAEVPPTQMTLAYGYLEHWDYMSLEDKRQVADSLINVVRATGRNIEIEWKI